MIALYLIAAVVGGILLVLSLFGGHHDAEHDMDAGHDHDTSHEVGGIMEWLPFFSLRFWTYGLAGFGLTGWLLTQFTASPAAESLPIALVTGFIAGAVPTLALRFLRKQEASTSVKVGDLMGVEAEVHVAIRSGQMGRVRVIAKDEMIDLLAISDEDYSMEPGSKVVIISVEGDRVRVVPTQAIFEDTLQTLGR
jgi:membrane protein implicated in regulation of membrane protease activity